MKHANGKAVEAAAVGVVLVEAGIVATRAERCLVGVAEADEPELAALLQRLGLRRHLRSGHMHIAPIAMPGRSPTPTARAAHARPPSPPKPRPRRETRVGGTITNRLTRFPHLPFVTGATTPNKESESLEFRTPNLSY